MSAHVLEVVEVVEVSGEARGEHPAHFSRRLENLVVRLVEHARALGVVRHARAVKVVLCELAKLGDFRGRCFASYGVISARACYSERHIARAVEQAEAAGLLVRAVPSVARRILGAATEYALPWWGMGVSAGLAGLAEVMSLRRRGVSAPCRPELARRIVDLIERAHPAELARSVARRVGGRLGAEVVEAFAGSLASESYQTRGPNKAIKKRTPDSSGGVSGSLPVLDVDRGALRPAVGDAGTAAALSSASERLFRALERRDRDGDSASRPDRS